MIKKAFTILFVFTIVTVFSQNSESSKNRASLEGCSLTKDAHRIDCFSLKLNHILFEEVLKNADYLKFSPDSELRTSMHITLDEDGHFKVEITDSVNPKLDVLIISTFAAFEKMFPVKNDKGQPIALNFNSTFIIHTDATGKVKLGAKKDEQEDVESDENVPFDIIEKVPVYPGCQGENNLELRNCLSVSIKNHIIENFNFSLINKLDLPRGLTKIYVNFTIDKTGKITDIFPKADHRKLEKEAIRIMKKVPRIEPGQQKGKAVGVLYSVPIVLQVE